MTRVESFNNFGLENFEALSVERVTALNSNFPTRISAENGMFGRIEGLSPILQRQIGWSSDIADFIQSPAEFRIYRGARLMETDIGGQKALIRNDINWHQVDTSDGATRGLTNQQRIERGHPPLDKNGRAIELHHVGQKRNSPLAELTFEEHRANPPGNSKILHPEGSSDVHHDDSQWQAEKTKYWKDRANAEFSKRQIASQAAKMGHRAGLQGAIISGTITGAITTVDNVRDVFNGEITGQEAAANIAIDVGAAAALGYGTTFISTAVSYAATKSAHTAIRTLGSAGVPAAAISFGITSYSSVVNFAQGEIGGAELAHDLGQNATGVAGAIGGAKVGAAIGVAAGPVGAAAGGLVGGMVGYLIAVEAYATVLDTINNGVEALTDRAVAVAETADDLMNRAVEMGQGVLDFVATNAPEALDTVRTSLNDFASSLRVPSISFG